MVRVRCPRCGHEWEYRGRARYATCPRCYRKVNVEKYRVIQPEVVSASSQSTEKSGSAFYLGVLPESEYNRLREFFIKCAEEVGADWIETPSGFELRNKDEEWLECLKRHGVDIVVKPG